MKKNTLLNLLNKNIMDLKNRIGDKIEYLGSTENLKLHEIAMYCYDNNVEIELFNIFCQFEFDNFMEILKENDIELNYIGRTSTFRVIGNYFLTNDNYSIYEIENFDNTSIIKEKIIYLIENYFYKSYSYCFDFKFDKEGNIIDFDYNELKNYILEYSDSKEVLKNIYKELWNNNVIEELNNIVSTYKYIQEFKENQIEIFKNFLEIEE